MKIKCDHDLTEQGPNGRTAAETGQQFVANQPSGLVQLDSLKLGGWLHPKF